MAELDVSPVTFRVKARPVSSIGLKSSTGATVILVPMPGGNGPVGPPGDGAQVFGEIPSGDKDGSNVVFNTAEVYRSNSTAVYINGLREFRGVGYAESGGSIITFTSPPLSSDDVRIDYVFE